MEHDELTLHSLRDDSLAASSPTDTAAAPASSDEEQLTGQGEAPRQAEKAAAEPDEGTVALPMTPAVRRVLNARARTVVPVGGKANWGCAWAGIAALCWSFALSVLNSPPTLRLDIIVPAAVLPLVLLVAIPLTLRWLQKREARRLRAALLGDERGSTFMRSTGPVRAAFVGENAGQLGAKSPFSLSFQVGGRRYIVDDAAEPRLLARLSEGIVERTENVLLSVRDREGTLLYATPGYQTDEPRAAWEEVRRSQAESGLEDRPPAARPEWPGAPSAPAALTAEEGAPPADVQAARVVAARESRNNSIQIEVAVPLLLAFACLLGATSPDYGGFRVAVAILLAGFAAWRYWRLRSWTATESEGEGPLRRTGMASHEKRDLRHGRHSYHLLIEGLELEINTPDGLDAQLREAVDSAHGLPILGWLTEGEKPVHLTEHRVTVDYLRDGTVLQLGDETDKLLYRDSDYRPADAAPDVPGESNGG